MDKRVRAASLTLLVLVTGCGTRLGNGAFDAAGDTSAGTVTTTSSGAPGTAGTKGRVGTTATTGPGSGGAGSTTGSTSTDGSQQGRGAAGNTASDVGVTPTSITIGTVSSVSNAFDPSAFVGPQYGIRAFFADLNARGGIHGRTVKLVSCDDHGDGAKNQACTHSLVDDSKVFAFSGGAIFKDDGAAYVQSKGVPDVGGQPIDTAYDRYSHLFDLYGEQYPRNGAVGYGGKLVGGTEVYRYFAQKFPSVPKKAAVIYYNQSASQRYGSSIVTGLEKEGYDVTVEQVNFALPDFDSAVLDMKSAGVRYVYDALDAGGNENLCASMDSDGLTSSLTAKVTTPQSWTDSIGSDYSSSPACRNKIWATGNTRNYEDTSDPRVAAFRSAMTRLGTDGRDQLSEWALEGWAGAQWLTDAISSCGADVTRTCVESFMTRPTEYVGDGLLTGRDFVTTGKAPATKRTCLNVARWQDSAASGRGGWVTQVPDMMKNCFTVPQIAYSP